MSLFVRKFSIYVLALCGLFSVESCLSEGGGTDAKTDLISENQKLPPFEVTLNDETTFRSDSLGGRCAMIVFFTTACEDCRKVLPVVEVFYREHALLHDMHVVCIAREQNRATVSRYWRDNQLELPFSPQDDRRIYNLFATQGVPRIYMADSTGIVRTIFRDTNPPTLQQLIARCPACQSK